MSSSEQLWLGMLSLLVIGLTVDRLWQTRKPKAAAGAPVDIDALVKAIEARFAEHKDAIALNTESIAGLALRTPAKPATGGRDPLAPLPPPQPSAPPPPPPSQAIQPQLATPPYNPVHDNSSGLDARLADVMRNFSAAAAIVPPVPSDYRAALARSGELRDVVLDNEGNLQVLGGYEGGPIYLLAAVMLDADHFALVPSVNYLKEFGVAFNKETSAGAAIKAAFDIGLDGTQKLKCLRPALVARDGNGVTVKQRGLLDGYVSAV